jgi:hypothetical protein
MKRLYPLVAMVCIILSVIHVGVAFATPDGSADNAVNQNSNGLDCIRMENSVAHYTNGFTLEINNFITNTSRGRAAGCAGSTTNWVDNEYAVFYSSGISPPSPSFCYYVGTAGWITVDFVTTDNWVTATPCGNYYYATSSNHYLSRYSGSVDDSYIGMVSGWNYLHN